MRTKQECLLAIPFEYIIAFSKETRLLRSNGYCTKKDFVQHLLRSLNIHECERLYQFYAEGRPYREASKYFLAKRPTGYIVSGAFVNYLDKTTHDLGKLFFEFPIANTRVDILRLNGSSYAYEVKSQRDRLDRLRFQLPAARKLFEYVSVIFPLSLKNKVMEIVDGNVGLYSFDIRDEQPIFEVEKEQTKNDEIYPEAQLDLLRLDELQTMCSNFCEKKPTRLEKNEMIRVILNNMNWSEANDAFKKVIQKRVCVPSRSSLLIKGTFNRFC